MSVLNNSQNQLIPNKLCKLPFRFNTSIFNCIFIQKNDKRKTSIRIQYFRKKKWWPVSCEQFLQYKSVLKIIFYLQKMSGSSDKKEQKPYRPPPYERPYGPPENPKDLSSNCLVRDQPAHS